MKRAGDILSNFGNCFPRDSILKILLSKLIKKSHLHLTRMSRWLLPFIFLMVASFVPPQGKFYTLKRVVIDAGHGGHDSGCLGSTIKEKDVALAVVLKLGKYIEDNFKDVKVIYTRKTDVFVELYERAAIANNAKADLFICVHCNSACVFDKKKRKDICNDDPHGIETWVMGLNKSEANLAVAKRENEVVLLEKDYKKQYDGFDPDSPEANIIFSLYQNTYLDQSLRFASGIEEEIGRKGREQRGVKQAGFLVLYKTYMPSVLIETGFLSNPSEEKFLASEKGQDLISRSIFNAFKAYKNSVESNAPSHDRENHPEPPVKEPSEDKPSNVPADSDHNDFPKPVIVQEPVVKNDVKEIKKEKTEPAKNVPRAAIKNDELSFGVQVALSPKSFARNNPKFKGLNDIREERVNGMFKYVSGNFTTLDDAVEYQGKMRSMGFNDAFVVAYKNGERITIKEARELLKKK